MKKCALFAVCILSCSCGSKRADLAALPTTSLVTTAGPIPAALEHTLTRGDIQRLRRFWPKTLKRIEKYHPLHMEDMINMTRAGVCDTVIINEIWVTRSRFYLTAHDEEMLLQSGVSRRVINEMIDTTADHY